MAIINAKRLEADEEAARQARVQAEEYAQRHDTAWQQPPPAYEEAAEPGPATTSISASSSLVPNAQSSTQASQSSGEASSASSQGRGDGDLERNQAGSTRNMNRARQQRRSRASGSNNEGGDEGSEAESEESMPLLTNRQKRKLKRTLQMKHKIARSCKFIAATLLLSLLVLFLYDLIEENNAKRRENSKPRIPDYNDGQPIEDPKWSKPVERPPETWISPSTPVYASTAWFSFRANHSVHFLHAQGSSYSGVVWYTLADTIPLDRWKELHGGEVNDRIAVAVEADFTHQHLRDLVRVNKMRVPEADSEGVGIYADSLPTTGNSFIAFRVTIYLPTPDRRSKAGLAYDGTSWFPKLQAVTDNLRLSFEALRTPDDERTEVSFGEVHFDNVNGGVSLSSPFLANDSVSIKVNNGHIRDVTFSKVRPMSIAAPNVDLTVLNGPIWILGAVATETVSLRTATGGVNISNIATAKRIYSSTIDGVLGGKYAATEKLAIHSKSSDIQIDVNLDPTLHAESLEKTGLLALLGPDAPPSSRSSGRWPDEVDVNVHNQVGSVFVRYSDQKAGVLLHSNVTSSAGSLDVFHAAGFEGWYELQTMIGTIDLEEPGGKPVLEMQSALPQKVFVIDREERWRIGGKLVKGRLWFSDHRWEDGGSSRTSKFPISTSFVKSDVGALRAHF